MTNFINPNDIGRDKVVEAMINITKGGADFSFECIGNVNTMRQALECCSRMLLPQEQKYPRVPSSLLRGAFGKA